MHSLTNMIIEFDKLYAGLICKDVPKRQLKMTEDGDSYRRDNEYSIDPWDGEKPYAKDGFVVRYCVEKFGGYNDSEDQN